MPRDIEVKLGDNVLERGCVLKDDVVMGRLYGNPDGPVIVVMGGISASRFIADAEETTARNNGRGWWSTLVREGGPIDLNKFQVLGMDFAPAVESDNRPDCITTHDQAARLKALLDAEGISKVAAIIGSSYGGMTALAFAHDYPAMVGQLCIIGAAHKPYPDWGCVARYSKTRRSPRNRGGPPQGRDEARTRTRHDDLPHRRRICGSF